MGLTEHTTQNKQADQTIISLLVHEFATLQHQQAAVTIIVSRQSYSCQVVTSHLSFPISRLSSHIFYQSVTFIYVTTPGSISHHWCITNAAQHVASVSVLMNARHNISLTWLWRECLPEPLRQDRPWCPVSGDNSVATHADVCNI